LKQNALVRAYFLGDRRHLRGTLHGRDFLDARSKAAEPGRWQTDFFPALEVLRPLRHGDFDFLRGDFLLGGIIFIYAFFFIFFTFLKILKHWAHSRAKTYCGFAA
jgi:hypothetical protein